MWQRFTEVARKTVFYAQEAARALGSPSVDTEHLLLGLLQEPESLAVRILNTLGIEAERLRKEVTARMPQQQSAFASDLTLAPQAKTLIDLAYREAREELEDDYLGTEHLLLGLLREEKGIAPQALAQLGFELENARLAIAALQVNDAAAKERKTETRTKGKIKTCGNALQNARGRSFSTRRKRPRSSGRATSRPSISFSGW